MGYLTAAVWLPSLLFGVHAGAWVDRFGRRRILMITADVGRAALLTSSRCATRCTCSRSAQLYAVAFARERSSTLFTVCDGRCRWPSCRGPVRGGQLAGVREPAFSFVGGPSLGGLLVRADRAVRDRRGRPVLPRLGVLPRRIRPPEPPADASGKGSLTAGARFILGSPVVRASLAAVSVINFFDFVFSALFVLYATRSLHMRPGLLGLVLGAGAVGGVIGSLSTRRLADRIGIGWAYVDRAPSCSPAPLALVPLAGGPRPLVLGMLFLAEFGSGFGVMLLDISIGSIFAAVIPAELRSRVNGAFQTVNYGTRPLGALAGGTLGTLMGLRLTLWVAVTGAVTGFVWLLPSVSRFRMPPPAASDPAASDPAAGGTAANDRAATPEQ